MDSLTLSKINAIMHKFNYNDLWRIRKRLEKKAVKGFNDIVQVMEENFKDRWDIRVTNDLSMLLRVHNNTYGWYSNYPVGYPTWERDWRDYMAGIKRQPRSNTVIESLNITELVVPPIKATKLEVMMWYPKLTIRNSKGVSRELLDMIVKVILVCEKGKWVVNGFMGGRLTFTASEYFVGYVHSHLSRIGMFEGNQYKVKFSGFCTGGDSIKQLEMEYSAHNSLENFEAFILMIETYLSWESLEGGPYVHMDNSFVNREVQADQPSINIYNKAKSLFSSIWSNISNRFQDPPAEFLECLEWELTNRGYRLLITDKLVAYYRGKLTSDCMVIQGEGNRLFEYKEAMNPDNFSSINRVNLRAPFLMWRGEMLRAKVIDDIPDALKHLPQEKIIIHPSIIKYVNSKLEAIINNKITDEIAIRKVSENRDTKGSNTQDQVSLQGNS